MSEISRVALFGKLNSLAYKAIEGATVFCKLRGNPYVELEHWLMQMLQHARHRPAPHRPPFRDRLRPSGGRLHRRARPAAARRDLDLGSGRAHCRRRRARLGVRHADVRRQPGAHRPSVCRDVEDPLARAIALIGICKQFERIKPDVLGDDFAKIVAGSPEESLKATDGTGARRPAKPAARWRRRRWASRRRSRNLLSI